MVKKIVGITFIFICTAIGWMILGTTLEIRSHDTYRKLSSDVGRLWGSTQQQKAPTAKYFTEKKELIETDSKAEAAKLYTTKKIIHDMPIQFSRVNVSLDLNQRKKGLLWYSTYKVRFSGSYGVMNPTDETRKAEFSFKLPSVDAVYDNFKISIDGSETENFVIKNGYATCGFHIEPGRKKVLTVTYGSQGMKEWWYKFGTMISRVKNFDLTIHTNFDGYDFPSNSFSPTTKTKAESGWDLNWKYENLLSGVQIGIAMPRKLNPGPWVERVTFSAPISLFLFFFLLFIITTRLEVSLHPMHYFFIGAAYFSFHLLMAYMVDHVSLQTAFVVSSLVSLFLVISYMRIVTGTKFAIIYVGLAQLIYQVLFSCTYFIESFTGLSITILCILTLFFVMQFTARVDWYEAFRRKA